MKYKKIIFLISIVFIILIILNGLAVVSAAQDGDVFQSIYSTESTTNLDKQAGNFMWIACAIGISSGVVMIGIIGFKILIASPEGKAEVKKQLIGYAIGAMLVVSGGVFAGIIAAVSNNTIRLVS